MQQLEAVNYLLSLIGSPPVGDLETLHPDVQSCIDRLNEATATIQKEGWWFNTEYKWTFTPDSTTQELELPTFTLEADVTSRRAVVKRGTKLYDTLNHTYQFTTPLTANLIVQLNWDLLDLVVQDTIKFFAGVQLCEFDLEDAIKAQGQQKFYTKSLADMKKTHLRSQRRNIMATPATRFMRNGIRPYQSGGAGIDPTYPGGS